MKIISAFDKLAQTSREAGPRTSGSVFLKVVEEVGEMATAIGIPDKAPEPLECESADCMIASYDTMIMALREEYPSASLEEIQDIAADIITRKLNKWRKSAGLEAL